MAECHQWNDDERFVTLSLSLSGNALKVFDLARCSSKELTMAAIVTRMEERFGKQQLPAAVALEFSTMSQGNEETIEQWGERIFDVTQRAFGPDVNLQVLHNQMVTRFTAGYSAINCVPPSNT